MKKAIVFILAIVLVLTASACGKSKAAKGADELIAAIGTVSLDSEEAIVKAEEAMALLNEKDMESLENAELLKKSRLEFDELVKEENIRIEKERKMALITSESWFEIYEGDEYTFNPDGTGKHGGIDITFEMNDNVIETTEGAAGTKKVSLQIRESETGTQLVPDGSDSYYALESDFLVISEAIRAEITDELTRHEAWTLRNGTQFMMYFMFYESGDGFAVTPAGTVSLDWEFVDNNTLKVTVTTSSQEMSMTYDIIDSNGSYTLVQTNNSNVTLTPHT